MRLNSRRIRCKIPYLYPSLQPPTETCHLSNLQINEWKLQHTIIPPLYPSSPLSLSLSRNVNTMVEQPLFTVATH